ERRDNQQSDATPTPKLGELLGSIADRWPMNTEKREMTKSARHAAMKLLQSPWLFSEILAAVRKLGLVEELQNALVTYIVGTSRLRQRPLNLMIKGASSSGKNFLADTVLKLFPEKSVHQ